MRKKYIYSICCLISVFVVFGLIGGSRVFAACSENDGIVTCEGGVTAYVRVPAACSFTRASGSGNYSEILANNTTITMDGSTFNTICNDTEGYAIYAIGFSGFEAGNTDLMAATVGSEYNIKTNGTGSNWKMKLSAGGNVTPTIENDFEDYQNIPADYTKIASYNSSVSMQEVSSITASYQVTASDVQPADNYSGKVLYLLVHPMSLEPVDVEQAFYNNGKEKYNGYYKMQDMNPTICSQIAPMSEAELIDIRDDKIYWVAKLPDGNCWMTQDLGLTIDSEKTYTSQDTDILEDWAPVRSTYGFYNREDWEDDYDSPESYNPGQVCWTGNFDYDFFDNCKLEDSRYIVGTYYNLASAMATNNLYSLSDTQRKNQSICPAGWKLPTITGDKSYQNLAATLHLTAGLEGNIQKLPTYFIYGGLWDSHSSGNNRWYPRNVGSEGYYWSTTFDHGPENAYNYALYFDDNGNIVTNYSYESSRGLFVRCVAR